MVAVARKHQNVYIDTSAYTSARLPAELVAFMRTKTGSGKVLFGTNYPMIGHGHAGHLRADPSDGRRAGAGIARAAPAGSRSR